MISACMDAGYSSHPSVVMVTLNLLWSINERLAGGKGIDAQKPALGLLEDMLDVMAERAARRPKAEDEE